MQITVARRVILNIILAGALVAILVPMALAGKVGPTTEEQMAGLQEMYAESAGARAARQSEKPLYERFGGYDRILELTTEVVRLHGINCDECAAAARGAWALVPWTEPSRGCW